MKPKYCAVFGNSGTEVEQVVGLTETQLIQALIERGMHRVSSITYDVPTSGKVRPLEGTEMLSIWKRVYRKIVERQRNRTVQRTQGRL